MIMGWRIIPSSSPAIDWPVTVPYQARKAWPCRSAKKWRRRRARRRCWHRCTGRCADRWRYRAAHTWPAYPTGVTLIEGSTQPSRRAAACSVACTAAVVGAASCREASLGSPYASTIRHALEVDEAGLRMDALAVQGVGNPDVVASCVPSGASPCFWAASTVGPGSA